MAAAGEAVHGEADFVASFGPATRARRRMWHRPGRHRAGPAGHRGRRRRRRPRHAGAGTAPLGGRHLGARRPRARSTSGARSTWSSSPATCCRSWSRRTRAAAVASCAGTSAAGGRLVIGAGLRAGLPSVDDLDRWAADGGARARRAVRRLGPRTVDAGQRLRRDRQPPIESQHSHRLARPSQQPLAGRGSRDR